MPGAPNIETTSGATPHSPAYDLLAEGFAEDGWAMRPGKHSTIAGLPIHIYEDDGEPHAHPCAEVLATEPDIDWILEEGYMQLASIKNQGCSPVGALPIDCQAPARYQADDINACKCVSSKMSFPAAAAWR